MNKQEIAHKNLMLGKEFDLYLLDNPEIQKQIPRGAYLALLPDGDPELAEINLQAAQRYKDAGTPVVYARIKKMRPIVSRITGMELTVEKKRAARNRKGV